MYTKDKLDEITEAKKKVVEGNLVLWRTRLETCINTGSAKSIPNILQAPVEPQEANNCNCTNTVPGCGQPTEGPNDFSDLPPPPGNDTPLPGVND